MTFYLSHCRSLGTNLRVSMPMFQSARVATTASDDGLGSKALLLERSILHTVQRRSYTPSTRRTIMASIIAGIRTSIGTGTLAET